MHARQTRSEKITMNTSFWRLHHGRWTVWTADGMGVVEKLGLAWRSIWWLP